MGPDASSLISSPISAPSAVPNDHVLLPGDRFGDDAVCCTRMRMLSHPLEDLRIAILFLMKKKLKRRTGLANESRDLDPYTLPS